MKTVTAHVYGKDYTLACDVGQEHHLTQLVMDVNNRTHQLERAVGKLPEPMMLLYTALMVADELHDAKRDVARLRDELTRHKEELANTQQQLDEMGSDDGRLAALEEEVATSLNAIAARMDGLADKLAA